MLDNYGEDTMKKMLVILVSLITSITSFVPAQAFPTAVTITSISSDVQQVRDSKNIRRKHARRGNHYERRNGRRHHYSNHRRYGHRNNAGAIIGGFAAGAIIGGAIASQNRNERSCAARYRSYRASDNTYQPYSGPRRVCR